LDGASGNVLIDLAVTRTGDEAVHLRAASSDNIVRASHISETGLTQPEFGEGIYIGSAESNWCRYTDCEPDRSDRNQIFGNTVSSTTAEAIDIKEGTTGGAVRGNTLSIGTAAEVDSVIDIKGDDWVIEDNAISVSAGAGIQVHSVLEPWGSRNRIVGNVFDMDVDAHAVVVARDALSRQNVIGCDNTVGGRAARTEPVCGP
jgi:predicted RNA-binding protein